MTFVVALSSFIAVIGVVMLLLWGIERIETRLRRVAPALFSSWMQLHALAAIIFVIACVAVWPESGQPWTIGLVFVPLMAATLAYLAPLAFMLIVAIHNPDVIAGLAASAFRRIRGKAHGRLGRRGGNKIG